MPEQTPPTPSAPTGVPTPNPGATIDAETFSVRRTVTIAASLDKVWAAITEPQHIASWFGQRTELDTLAVGARGVFGFDGYGDFPVRIEELDPPHVIAYRWSNDNASPVDPDEVVFAHSTVFRFELEELAPATAATPPSTRLTVVESGFDTLDDPTAAMAGNQGGWTSELDELVAYLEGPAADGAR